MSAPLYRWGEGIFCRYDEEHSQGHLEKSKLNRTMRGEVGESKEERGPRSKRTKKRGPRGHVAEITGLYKKEKLRLREGRRMEGREEEIETVTEIQRDRQSHIG